MDITLLTIILVALLVLAPLVLLVISGQLIRSRMHLPAPTRRGKRDLQSLEDALVEFFARSKASSCILTAWLRVENRLASMRWSSKSGWKRSGGATMRSCQRARCERCS